jgi:DNA-binding GntR family transcriptional regulator
MTNRDDHVRAAILRHALHAQPVTLESLAAAMRTSPEDIRAALAALHKAGS